MMSCGAKAGLLDEQIVSAFAHFGPALEVSAWPRSSNAITTTAAP